MKIIITGAAGFIGSAVCRYTLRETGASIVCLDKITYAAHPDTLSGIVDGDRAVFEHVDICDRAELDRVFAGEDCRSPVPPDQGQPRRMIRRTAARPTAPPRRPV